MRCLGQTRTPRSALWLYKLFTGHVSPKVAGPPKGVTRSSLQPQYPPNQVCSGENGNYSIAILQHVDRQIHQIIVDNIGLISFNRQQLSQFCLTSLTALTEVTCHLPESWSPFSFIVFWGRKLIYAVTTPKILEKFRAIPGNKVWTPGRSSFLHTNRIIKQNNIFRIAKIIAILGKKCHILLACI